MFGRKARKKNAVVLGCGPAGMFATHALAGLGYAVRILSKPRKSHMYGAQYLHMPIPDLPAVRRDVRYLLEGTAEGYAQKVYGDGFNPADTSPAQLLSPEPRPVWDIRAAYDAAWETYSCFIEPMTIEPGAGAQATLLPLIYPERASDCSVVISTIPVRLLCSGGHQFRSAKIWAAGDAPDRGIAVPIPCENDTVVCNGDKDVGWYRKSRMFDHTTVEWPAARKPPVNWVAAVEKPIATNCRCLPEVIRVGRYGSWQKGYLAHQAYTDVLRLLI